MALARPSSEVAALPGKDKPRCALAASTWVWLNLKVGAFSFGTGSVAPIYRRALVVEARALTADEFQDVLTIAQLLPGPNLVSLSMALGSKLFGYSVGVLGVVALCVPGALWALLTTLLIPIQEPLVRAVVAGFAIGAAILLLELTLQLEQGLRCTHVPGQPASTGRRCARGAVVLAIAALSIFGAPLLLIVVLGILGGAAAELPA